MEFQDDDEISDLEDALISEYDYLEDVNIEDIGLDGDEDDIDVAINVDLDDYGGMSGKSWTTVTLRTGLKIW